VLRESIFLTPQPLRLLPIAFDDALVLLDLLLIGLILRFFLALHVISDKRSRSQSDTAADGSP
jgi:hypothetical protein